MRERQEKRESRKKAGNGVSKSVGNGFKKAAAQGFSTFSTLAYDGIKSSAEIQTEKRRLKQQAHDNGVACKTSTDAGGQM